MTIINDFDAAKAVTEQLKGMDKERQEKILRWVSESLGLERPQLKTDQEKKNSSQDNASQINTQGHTNIKSFIETKRPRSDVQFATAVAYFYKFEAKNGQKREAIDTSTLQDAARLVGRNRFNSPKNTLNNAKKQGYLDAADRGAFKINTVGENLVAMTLPGDSHEKVIRKSQKARPRKRTNGRKKSK